MLRQAEINRPAVQSWGCCRWGSTTQITRRPRVEVGQPLRGICGRIRVVLWEIQKSLAESG